MPIYKMDGKKDGKQKYRVRINYTNKQGESKQIDRVAYGKEEAKELEFRLTNELKQQSTVVARKLTINELYHEYIKVKKCEARESSIGKTTQHIELHVLPYIGHIRIDKLTTSVLQDWKLKIEESTVRGKGEKKLALNTKQAIYVDLNAMLNYAVKMEYIQKNSLSVLGNFKDPYAEKPKINFYVADEFKLFIDASRKYAQKIEEKGSIIGWHFYVFFATLFYLGPRKGEVYALKWTDIDNDVLHITRSITQKLKGEDRETPPKNKSSIRDLRIPEPLLNIFDEHKKRCMTLPGFSENWRICGGTAPIRDSTCDKKKNDFANAAGIKSIRIHDFRHSHASVLINEGINIMEIARRLGHSNVQETWNTYAHLYPREEDRAIQILNKIA